MAKLSLVKGGRENAASLNYKFISASATDTRLMGVLGLRVHWLVTDDENPQEGRHVYMFFYYDIEEIGLDTLSVYELYDKQSVELATISAFGGLGASMLPLKKRDALYMIQSFVGETKKRLQPLPENAGILDFVLSSKIEISKAEIRELNLRLCTKLPKDCSLVNYYLMRSFGKDEEGAELLRDVSSPANSFEEISLKTHATFLKNTIEKFYNNDGVVSYLSESLVEAEGGHYIVISDLRVSGKKVTYARKIKEFPISLQEASMLLARPEYITVYKILCPMESFDIDFAPFCIGTTGTSHESGDMYMEFRQDNNHVDRSVFCLYDDIQTLFFVSDFGELVVAGYSPADIQYAEDRIEGSFLMGELSLDMKYHLANSIIYDFAESGCTSFKEFIQFLE